MKLYRLTDKLKEYWQVWVNEENTFTIQWGLLGTEGQSKIVKPSFFSSFFKKSESTIQSEIDELIIQGFHEIDIEDQITLLIEYAVDGMGNTKDIDKRNQLIDRMNDTLGRTGLGHCDGGTIGSGSMEVCNFVVDFEIAKSVIEKDLAGTKFGNFTRIFDENSQLV